MRNKGLEWEELLPPGGYGSAEYKAIVPSGNLPALIDNGFTLADLRGDRGIPKRSLSRSGDVTRHCSTARQGS